MSHRSAHAMIGWLARMLVAVICLCSGGAWSVTVVPLPLAKGTLLAAGPHVSDPRFRESVILITDYGRAGSAGLIINHPAGVPVAHALPEINEPKGIDGSSLFIGGPLADDDVFILLRSAAPLPIHQHLFADIYFGHGAAALRQLAGRTTSQEALRIYVGHVGWATGQLEAEIEHGDWIVTPPDGEAVFDLSPHVLWKRFIKNWSGQWL